MTNPTNLIGVQVCPLCHQRFWWHTAALVDPSRPEWWPRMLQFHFDQAHRGVSLPMTGTTGITTWQVY